MATPRLLRKPRGVGGTLGAPPHLHMFGGKNFDLFRREAPKIFGFLARSAGFLGFFLVFYGIFRREAPKIFEKWLFSRPIFSGVRGGGTLGYPPKSRGGVPPTSTCLAALT